MHASGISVISDKCTPLFDILGNVDDSLRRAYTLAYYAGRPEVKRDVALNIRQARGNLIAIERDDDYIDPNQYDELMKQVNMAIDEPTREADPMDPEPSGARAPSNALHIASSLSRQMLLKSLIKCECGR